MTDHEAMRDLVAAYALDAVEGAESDLVKDHVRVCVRCRAELSEYREAAAMLAYTGGPAPEGLWERIVAGLSEASPPVRLAPFGASPRRRRLVSWHRGTRMGWAAAAVILAAFGVVAAHDTARLNRLDAALADQGMLRQVAAAAIDPGARRAALASFEGPTRADAVVLASGQGFLIAEGLAPLPTGRTYQLWAIVKGRPISAAVLGRDPGLASFRADPAVATLAITNEVAGGATQPSGAPVAAGTVN